MVATVKLFLRLYNFNFIKKIRCNEAFNMAINKGYFWWTKLWSKWLKANNQIKFKSNLLIHLLTVIEFWSSPNALNGLLSCQKILRGCCCSQKYFVFFETTVSPTYSPNEANWPFCDITNCTLCRIKKTNAK